MEHVLDGALAHAAAVGGLALVVGPSVWRAATGPDAEAGAEGGAGLEGGAGAEGGARRRAAAEVGAALLGGAFVLLLVAIVAVVEGPVTEAVATVLTKTAYGASLGAFAAGAGAATVLARRRAGRGVAGRGAVVLGTAATWSAAAIACGALARLGHAATDGGWTGLGMAVHVAAAVAWAGGLVMAVGADARSARRFGRVAVVCVAVLVITGALRAVELIAAGWARVGREEAGFAWVLALGMKLAAVGVALGLAARVRAAARAGRAPRVEAELGAVGIVVLLAALMGQLATP